MSNAEQSDLERRVAELEAEVKALRGAMREIARRLPPRSSAPPGVRY